VLLGLDLSHLASIELNNSAGLQFTPLVPEVSHADLIAESTRAFRVTIDLSCLNERELLINFIFE
jgi:hypothetical protein